MVLLLKPINNNKLISPTHITKFLYSTSFSTTITTQNETANEDDQVQVLYNMISPAAITPNTSLVPILDQWLHHQQQGGNNNNVKVVTNSKELVDMIKLLRNRNRYSHALQLSEWMTYKSYLDQSSGNIAVHLDLISRVRGLEHAEKFFDAIPDPLKDFKVYGTLLNCYAFNKSLKKAEATMEKMKQLRFMTTHSYHSMLTLYNKTRNYDKLLKLLHEMDKEGVRYHRTTYYMQLTAYASFDIKAMEKLLFHIEFNSEVPVDWHVYIIAAKGYLNFGKKTKALVMLKKAEELLQFLHQNTNGVAYEILLSMYANLKKKDDVYRIWDLYKKTWRKVNNKGYHHMISSLVKLDDINGAEKIMTEWESQTSLFDFWVVNLLVNGYSKKGDWKKAEDYVERLVCMGKQPSTSTWDCLATAFCKYKEMEKAVDAMRKAILSYDNSWKLNQITLTECVNYLEEKGDMVLAKEFSKFTKGRAADSESVSNKNLKVEVLDATG